MKPQAGKFTCDLSQLTLNATVNADKTVSITSANPNAGIALAAASSTGSTGAAASAPTVTVSIGGFDLDINLSALLDDKLNRPGTYTLSGSELIGAVASGIQAKLDELNPPSGAGSTGGGSFPAATASTGAANPAVAAYGSASLGNGGVAAYVIGPRGTGTDGAWSSDGKLAGAGVTVTSQGTTLIVEMDSAPSQKWSDANIDLTLRFSNGTIGNGSEQFAPTVEVEPVDSTMKRMYAQATVDLTDVTKTDNDLAQIATNRLTQAAKNNKQSSLLALPPQGRHCLSDGA